MALIGRISALALIIGFVGGVVARYLWGVRRLPLVLALSFVPWLLHVVNVAVFTLDRAAADPMLPVLTTELTIFVVASVVVAGGCAWLGVYLLRRRPLLVPATPLVLGMVYGLLPLLWFWSALRQAGRGLDSLAGLFFFWATLVVAMVLLGYTSTPRLPRRLSFLSRILKRRR